MSGGAWGFSEFPDEWRKLKADPGLAGNAAAEIIRYQTPVIYQRRTATRDVELGGEMIAAGDKVVMWYISGNRDESVFVDADRLQVDRPNARQHIAFGMGPHRCLGARQIGRAHVCTPVTNAHLVCRLLLETTHKK